jgi:hypothetical protein
MYQTLGFTVFHSCQTNAVVVNFGMQSRVQPLTPRSRRMVMISRYLHVCNAGRQLMWTVLYESLMPIRYYNHRQHQLCFMSLNEPKTLDSFSRLADWTGASRQPFTTRMRVVLVTAVLAAVVQRASSETFEYVIIGGGTCGLLLANRLSADPTVTVAVIEPGNDVRNNPNVTIIADWTKSQNSAIDWQYQSVPQPAAGNRTLTYHAGKAIGGTSTINGKYTLHVKGPWGANCVPLNQG